MPDDGTLVGVVARDAETSPNARAIVDELGVLTFEDLHRRVCATVTLLDDLVDQHARVAAIGPNHRVWVELYYAIPESQRTLVFLNHRLNVNELCSMIERSKSELIIGDPVELERLAEAGCDLPMLDWATWSGLVDGATGNAPTHVADPNWPAWLLFTSGTTAAPKGALLSQSSLLAAVTASAAARPVDADDVYLFPFPLCHVAGYNVIHRHAFGRPVVLMSGFAPADFCDAVERELVTSTSLAATMLASLLDLIELEPHRLKQLASLRLIAYGAAPMPSVLLQRAEKLLGVEFAQGYGMTELSGNAVFLDAAAHRRGLSSHPELLRAAGVPAPGVELRIVDLDNHRVEVDEGIEGEILVRARQIMLGYLDDDAATSAVLTQGWLHTGDVGRIVDGVLYVTDRKKDIIITGGENVSSLEVEDVVLRHPSVLRAAVIGVPDATWGENICAVVVLREGADFDSREASSFVRQSLAGFKAPRHFVVVDELPATSSGKVVKAQLREWLGRHPELLGPRL
jgi:acyl-CoA synthetase (AMP-forming)/AMP-acid ligase II